MSQYRQIAVIDIGKTNAKVVVLSSEDGQEIAARRTPNRVLSGPPYGHFDAKGLWAFILESLRDFAVQPGYEAISITTHGASCVVLDGDGELALPIIDYEYLYPPEVVAAYETIRPGFAESFSPRLPGGLNVGAQLHFQRTCFPEAFAKVRTVLTYPQYWAFRLTGVLANEVTSLGCHTDLWCPEEGAFSPLVDALEMREKMAPMRSAFDVLGPVKDDVRQVLQLPAPVPVYCGIHDSNASLLPHLLRRKPPFSVLSTGTWIISFAVGGRAEGLDPGRDTLCNVDAYGRAVPSARYMGGREFELLTAGVTPPSDGEIEAAVFAVLERGVMILPNAGEGCGPLPGQRLEWVGKPVNAAEQVAAVSLYSAMMTNASLALIADAGPVVVEGPFAKNHLYLRALAALTGRKVIVAEGGTPTGTAEGAALLTGIAAPAIQEKVIGPAGLDLSRYHALFQQRVAARQ
ncbi:FGGY-family carbohydrate kinase [Rhizobium paknamense]|uniref:Sugar (Pentulose or hexulose) kinase n=1 Tax=Rhizobium paknamense TaxID=1206817 RepID=A0ABU0IE20_9HYPH|nr:FGGY-family carbohydrate kinase [Rhizobium paknamense]MDQ0456477.1 sugar (pentulose or hexulose) kinase [Rhizobium paknamense]